MKILSLHVDHISFKPLKKALKKIPDLHEKERKGATVKDALAILTAVEKSDSDTEKVVDELVKNVKEIAKSVDAKNIVLYPYAHLSSDLASPEVATEVLDKSEKELKKIKSFRVLKAPFGYYKEFELKVKGHPLAELSRNINVGEKGVKRNKEREEEEIDCKQLLRGIGKNVLDTSKLKNNDHRIISNDMDLFSFSEVAPGMVFWHNNGLIIYNELLKFERDLIKKRGYEEIRTPQILDKKLWQISGHWEKYKENIFLSNYENREFAVKPMSCPGGILVYKNTPKSYKQLPLRVGEFGVVHRQELSGVLGGIFRVIQFTQDDGHIYCTERQIEGEIIEMMKLIDIIYSKFGFKFKVELSTRPEKRIGTNDMWNKAERALESSLKKNKYKFKINKGDGAFYGPKIDYHLTDSLGRTWQCGTIQLDFSMPERFNLEYTDKDNKKKRPVMLHRTLIGSLERFIGILLEHTNGRLPTWLSPVQVRILSFTERNVEYSENIIKKLAEKIPKLRIGADFQDTPIQGKVKEAELMRIPYIIVIGDNEEKENSLAVRVKGDKKIQAFSLEDFANKLEEEINERK